MAAVTMSQSLLSADYLSDCGVDGVLGAIARALAELDDNLRFAVISAYTPLTQVAVYYNCRKWHCPQIAILSMWQRSNTVTYYNCITPAIIEFELVAPNAFATAWQAITSEILKYAELQS